MTKRHSNARRPLIDAIVHEVKSVDICKSNASQTGKTSASQRVKTCMIPHKTLRVNDLSHSPFTADRHRDVLLSPLGLTYLATDMDG